MATTKYPFANIKSVLSKDITITLADGTDHVISKGATSATEAYVTYDSTDLGLWKIDSSTSDANYMLSKKRTSRKKTVNLPAKADGIVYLVSAQVAAVGRKIEGRTDLVTPADFIRARDTTYHGYIVFQTA